LLDNELVERLVVVEGIDHVIAIQPDRPLIIQVQAVRVAISRHIEPIPRLLFAKPRRLQQLIDEPFISVGRSVCQKRIDFHRRWR
jgi:hypothetical protein